MQLKIMLLFNLSENGNLAIKNFKFLYKNSKKLFVKKQNYEISPLHSASLRSGRNDV